MEPVTTAAMISTVVVYLAKKLKDNKSVQDFFTDFTDDSVKWIRPLFLREDNTNEKTIEDLAKNAANPSETKLRLIETTIASHLEDNPGDEKNLREMYEQLKTKAVADKSIRIINSKNVIIGNSSAGGDFHVGDITMPAPYDSTQ